MKKEVIYIIDLNQVPKEDMILILKDLFSDMCSSRRQLKPILSEILRAIDNHIFIDANTDEVKELLEEILIMQDKLSHTEELKKAAATRKLAVIDEAIREIAMADMLIVGGTSLNVYPAASYLGFFQGKHLVLINRDKTPYDSRCNLVINDSIGKVFERIEKEIIE